MAEYEESQVVRRAPEEVFAYLADVSHLPAFLPTVSVAEDSGPDLVHVAGSTAGGHDYDAEGLFRARPEQRRLEWGSRHDGHYSGWLQVFDSGAGDCEVTLHLSFFGHTEGDANRVDPEIGAALGRLRDLLEADRPG